jgi:hypothetical protein
MNWGKGKGERLKVKGKKIPLLGGFFPKVFGAGAR